MVSSVSRAFDGVENAECVENRLQALRTARIRWSCVASKAQGRAERSGGFGGAEQRYGRRQHAIGGGDVAHRAIIPCEVVCWQWGRPNSRP